MKMIHFRRIVQILTLSALIGAAVFWPAIAKPVLPWLSRCSPLMTLTTRLADWQWTPFFFGGVIVAFACLLYPRVFCGWLCPLGTCIDIADRVSQAEKRKFIAVTGWWLATGITLCLIVAAAAGKNIAGYLDPLTIFAHTLSRFAGLGFADQIDQPFESYGVRLETVMAGIFFTILAISLLGRRIWCRFLCPLGGLLGIFGALGLYRRIVTADCVHCDKCRTHCKMRAIPETVENTTHPACITCRQCDAICPKHAIYFKK